MSAQTYRADLYYINRRADGGARTESVVGPVRWWLHRIQFWRFHKMKNFRVLRDEV